MRWGTPQSCCKTRARGRGATAPSGGPNLHLAHTAVRYRSSCSVAKVIDIAPLDPPGWNVWQYEKPPGAPDPRLVRNACHDIAWYGGLPSARC